MQTIIGLCERISKILEIQTDALVNQNYELLSSCTLELHQIEKSLRAASSSLELSEEEKIKITSFYHLIKNKKTQNDLFIENTQQYINFLHDEVRYL